ncbi:cell shape-determining protein MreC [Clostridia bacterium]|nr:cell shape-determining protein MreC [Clostridia bacterium]
MKFLADHKWIVAFCAVLLLALALTVVSMLSPGAASVTSNVLGGVLNPAQEAVNTVSDWLKSAFGNQKELDELINENRRLRAHAAEVEEKARLYDQTLDENERLRQLLGFAQRRRDLNFISSVILSRDLDNYARTCTLSKGSLDGVASGMAAVSPEGHLVGVVSEVGVNFCTLRTIIDADFVCGAYAYRTNLEAVCEGRFDLMGENRTTLSGFRVDTDLKNGDIVLTSGLGGMYPRDLEIGYVQEVEFDPDGMTATAILAPSADLGHMTQVFLIKSFDIGD